MADVYAQTLDIDVVHSANVSYSRTRIDEEIQKLLDAQDTAQTVGKTLGETLLQRIAHGGWREMGRRNKAWMGELPTHLVEMILSAVALTWPQIGKTDTKLPFLLWQMAASTHDLKKETFQTYSSLSLMDNAELTSVDCTRFITILELSGLAVEDRHLLVIRNSTSRTLVALGLARTPITSTGIRKIFMQDDALLRLEVFNLRGCKLLDGDCLNYLARLPALSLLDTRDTGIDSAYISAFRKISEFPNRKWQKTTRAHMQKFGNTGTTLQKVYAALQMQAGGKNDRPLLLVTQIERPRVELARKIVSHRPANNANSVFTPALGRIWAAGKLDRASVMESAEAVMSESGAFNRGGRGGFVAEGGSHGGPLWMRTRGILPVPLISDLVDANLNPPPVSNGVDANPTRDVAEGEKVEVEISEFLLVRDPPRRSSSCAEAESAPASVRVPMEPRKKPAPIAMPFGKMLEEPCKVQRNKRKSDAVDILQAFASAPPKKRQVVVPESSQQLPITVPSRPKAKEVGTLGANRLGSRRALSAFSQPRSFGR